MSRPVARAPELLSNALLAALPAEESAGLAPYFEPVSLPPHTVLSEPDQPIAHVYFPTAGVISLLAVRAQGHPIEAGVIGREGFAGLPVFLGTDRSTGLSVVQVHLEALRMPALEFAAQVSRASVLHSLLLRYTHFLFTQVSQSVACCACHPVQERLCRWLLLVHDRTDDDRFPLTQQFLASMLGVRRASVSEVARALQEKKLVRYRRGQITILDRAGLERAACECFRLVRTEWNRLFG